MYKIIQHKWTYSVILDIILDIHFSLSLSFFQEINPGEGWIGGLSWKGFYQSLLVIREDDPLLPIKGRDYRSSPFTNSIP